MKETRVLVIADDLTGAAELAGIGYRRGLPTRLFRDQPSELVNGLTVIDTDSRHVPADVAAHRVRQAVAQIDLSRTTLIYKKTDSVLRGNIVAEVEALRVSCGRTSVALLPQNPSKERAILHGQYFIKGVPLDQTEFANDPDHPATSNAVRSMLNAPQSVQIANASTLNDVDDIAKNLEPAVLPAGGADFFRSILWRTIGTTPLPTRTFSSASRLFVSGSASVYAKSLPRFAAERGITCHPASTGDAWAAQVVQALRETGRALMFVDGPLDKTPGAGRRIQRCIAETLRDILREMPALMILIDGGATAAAVCALMGWARFDVVGSIGATDVQLLPEAQAGEISLIVKPGSYPWPEWVFEG